MLSLQREYNPAEAVDGSKAAEDSEEADYIDADLETSRGDAVLETDKPSYSSSSELGSTKLYRSDPIMSDPSRLVGLQFNGFWDQILTLPVQDLQQDSNAFESLNASPPGPTNLGEFEPDNLQMNAVPTSTTPPSASQFLVEVTVHATEGDDLEEKACDA